ncbi:MAG: SpoIID/LytB domain-containing protein [Elusimicrobia bacterium]|nr:SpoIID/LytB domain-containing protein [Elusimicrobiota bacterium]
MVVPLLVLAALTSAALEPPTTVRVRVFSKHAPVEAVVEENGRRRRLAAGEPAARLSFVSTFTVTVPGLPPRAYLGSLETSTREGRLVLVVASPLEPYTAGVSQAEAGAGAPAEALKAQAVAARSWAAGTRPPHEGAFCDLTHCQVFPGLGGAAGRAAAAATDGQLLRARGRIFPGHYHAACGGLLDAPGSIWPGTEGRGPARADAGRDGRALCALSPHARWRAAVPAARIERLARAAGWLGAAEPLTDLAVAERSPARRALTLKLNGAAIGAERFLSAVGRALGWNVLKSAAFELRREGADFVFEGRGLGHGVGMCQAGAAALAKGGASAREILEHYYPGALPPQPRCAGGTCLEGGGPRLLELLERERAALSGAPEAVRVVAHPDFDSFRAAGGSGRHAARWRDGILHLAPPAALEERGILESVVRHEMSHLWAARVSRGRAPRWLAEGVCVWRAGELAREDPALDEPILADGAVRLSYRQAGERVARVAERGGTAAVERLLEGGGLTGRP